MEEEEVGLVKAKLQAEAEEEKEVALAKAKLQEEVREQDVNLAEPKINI